MPDAFPHRYTAYGLRLASALPLPELTPDASAGPPDATVALGPVRALARRPVASGCFEAGPGYAFVCLERAAVARVGGGREVTVEPEPGADPALVRAFVLGAVLALLLGQRRHLVLHASAVALRPPGGPPGGPSVGAVAFAGEKGWGKSTTAAALVGRGHALLTDDLVVLDPRAEGPPPVRAGFAQMRLWPDALAGLGTPAEALPRVFETTDKRRWAPPGFDAAAAPPLRALYVLGAGDRPAATRLGPHEAVAEVIRHSFLRHLLRPSGLDVAHLGQVGATVRRVPVFRLARPEAIGEVPALAAFVEAHAAGLHAAGPHAAGPHAAVGRPTGAPAGVPAGAPAGAER